MLCQLLLGIVFYQSTKVDDLDPARQQVEQTFLTGEECVFIYI